MIMPLGSVSGQIPLGKSIGKFHWKTALENGTENSPESNVGNCH
jgi:hypothetical protein